MLKQKAPKGMFPCRNPQVCGVKNHYNGTVCRSSMSKMTAPELATREGAVAVDSLRTLSEGITTLAQVVTRASATTLNGSQERKDLFQTSTPPPPPEKHVADKKDFSDEEFYSPPVGTPKTPPKRTGKPWELQELDDYGTRMNRRIESVGTNPQHPLNPVLAKQYKDRLRRIEALRIATLAHEGQTDQLGAAYIDHPKGVQTLMERLPEFQKLTPEQQHDARVAAILHDVLEDTCVTADDLRRWGITESQLAAIDAVTSRDGEPKTDYYKRVLAGGPVSTCIKLGDLSHNNLEWRRASLEGAPGVPVPEGGTDRYTKLGKKYYIAFKALGADVPAHLRQFAPQKV